MAGLEVHGRDGRAPVLVELLDEEAAVRRGRHVARGRALVVRAGNASGRGRGRGGREVAAQHARATKQARGAALAEHWRMCGERTVAGASSGAKAVVSRGSGAARAARTREADAAEQMRSAHHDAMGCVFYACARWSSFGTRKLQL